MELADKLLRAGPLRAARAKSSGLIRAGDRVLAAPASWAIACLLVFVLQAALNLTHKPWLDEFQAIQLAVQAPDIATLLEWLRYEGHPPLWYFYLRGLAHLMEPMAALAAGGLLIALATQAMILFAAPFSRMERVLLALSEFMLFDFLALSRSMTLGVAVIVLALVIWRSRWVWLAIAILPLCDFLFGVISGMMVLMLVQERRLWIPGAVLWLAGGLAAAWSVIPAPDMLPALENLGIVKDTVLWMTSIGTLAVPFQGGLIPMWNRPVFPLAGVLWIAFLWFAWVQTRHDAFRRLLFFGFVGFTLAFSLIVYPLPLRHLMLIALLLIALAWLRAAGGARLDAGMRLWLAIVAVCGLATAAINFAWPFDRAEVAAREIERLGLTDKHWMVFPDSRAQGVSALTGIEFERTEQACMQSFIKWNYNTTLKKPDLLEGFLRDEIAKKGGRFYLLSDLDLSALPPDLLRPLVEIAPGYGGQEFYLFEVGPGLPDAAPDLPPCVEGRRPFERLR